MKLSEWVLQEIGARIRYHRERQGKTKQALARAVNKHPSLITHYEQGRYNIPIMTLYLIAECLQVSVGTLLPPNRQLVKRSQATVGHSLRSTQQLNHSVGVLLDKYADVVQATRLEHDLARVKQQRKLLKPLPE